jgi:hypothetical protein
LAEGFPAEEIRDHLESYSEAMVWLDLYEPDRADLQIVAEEFGPDLDAHTAAVKTFVDAGFTQVAVVQIGGAHRNGFLDWAEREFLPAFRG